MTIQPITVIPIMIHGITGHRVIILVGAFPLDGVGEVLDLVPITHIGHIPIGTHTGIHTTITMGMAAMVMGNMVGIMITVTMDIIQTTIQQIIIVITTMVAGPV